MNRIKALPRSVAERIASGEVIERPLSVVKELLENSIDAGATAITIEIKKGGKDYIRVTDNGCGIPPEEVELAFTRFATSKIYSYEDLSEVMTLGFRGVALSSIAAVSRVEMYTKTPDQKLGSRYISDGGENTELSGAACEDGTTIVVRNLFYNTPVRLSFLKSDNQEAALITDYVSKMAVAYSGIKIRLITNGSILFSTNGKSDLKQAILTVYSRNLTQGLIELSAVSPEGMCLKGFVSAPNEARKSRKYQIFYVNHRWVRSKALETALDEAFSDRLFDGFYPNAFLFLDLRPSDVDINILPNKTEIRFFDEDAVISFAATSIRQAITTPDAMPKAQLKTTAEFESNIKPEPVSKTSAVSSLQDFVQAPVINAYQNEDFFKELREQKTSVQEEFQNDYVVNVVSKTAEEDFSDKETHFPFSQLEIVGQIFATYILCQDENTMYVFDQHAAHERIMFEYLMQQFHSSEKVTQPLLVPFLIQLTPAEKQASEERITLLCKLGYEFEEFGPNDYAVKAVPASLSAKESEDFLTHILEKETLSASDSQIKTDEIISNACKAAVKANDRLSAEEMKALLRSLENCENPYSCPHGRPTFLKLSENDIERMFKRK